MPGKPITIHLHPVTDPEVHAAIEGDALAHPEWADLQNRYGLLLLAGGSLDRAEAAFRRALGTNPRYAWAQLNLACVLGVQERFDDARAVLDAAADPAPGARCVVSGWLAVLEGRPAAGERAVRRLSERAQRRPDVLWLRSSLASQAGADTAGTLWDRRLTDPITAACTEETTRLHNGVPWHPSVRGGLFPGLHTLWRDVSRMQARREDFGSSTRSARLAYLHWADAAAHRLHQGFLCSLQGNDVAAASYYREALDLDPEQPEAAEALSHHWAGMGDVDRAVEYIREAVRRAPGYSDYHRRLGALEAARGNLGEAVSAYGRALDRNPMFTVARLELGQVLFRARRWAEAAACYGRVLNAGLRSADILLRLARCQEELGEMDTAQTTYDEAAELAPGDPEIALRMGHLFRSRGDRERAKEAWRRYLQLSAAGDPAGAERGIR